MRTVFVWIAVVAVLAVGAFVLTRDETPIDTSVQLGVALGDDSSLEGYTLATGPRAFAFPADHGPHDDFKLEWWYFTGNLQSEGGRRFGYQFTVFRSALSPPDSLRTANVSSDWSTKQLYFAHFAVTDVEADQYYSFEKFSRGAVGLAGADAAPFRAWLEDWSVESVGSPVEGSKSIFPMRLRAVSDDVVVELDIEEPGKPMILQGDSGYSRKGSGKGQASYYYSYTSLPTNGTVTTPAGSFAVAGSSWMDREWSTSLLGEDQVGWDWFSLQLNDARELMFFRLRDADGTSSWTDGVLVEPDGSARRFESDGVGLTVLEKWISPQTGATYPSIWRMQIPDLGADLTITPFIRDQEFDGSIKYWEGAVQITGTLTGRPVGGHGYVEMTGYAAARSSRDTR